MIVRNAVQTDVDAMMDVYTKAKEYMDQSGNPNQWKKGHPSREIIEADIRNGQSFVVEQDGAIHGAFAFIFGDDPTYSYIEDGAWINEKPYGTIHRLAGDGAVKGIFSCCIEFCKEQGEDLRADTHHDNKTMQYLLEKNGFKRCGIIYLADGSPRIAYQQTKG